MTNRDNEQVCLTIFDDDTDRPLVRAMVAPEVFREYHRARNHDRYVMRKARLRERSYDAREQQGISESAYLDHLTARQSLEVFAADEGARYAALHEAMATLEPEMQEALWALACGETTEQALASEWAVSQSTVCRRKQKALRTLRAWLEAHGYER